MQRNRVISKPTRINGIYLPDPSQIVQFLGQSGNSILLLLHNRLRNWDGRVPFPGIGFMA